jgi:hypothetical protein
LQCIALVVTFDGFPLGYEVFAGNVHDARTLQTIVTTMETRHGVFGRVWITDRGMASAGNLAWLRETGRRYIGAPKSELKAFAAALAAPAGWHTVQERVEVKLCRNPETGETVIVCRSADRRSKERAIHDRFSRRIVAALVRVLPNKGERVRAAEVLLAYGYGRPQQTVNVRKIGSWEDLDDAGSAALAAADGAQVDEDDGAQVDGEDGTRH